MFKGTLEHCAKRIHCAGSPMRRRGGAAYSAHTQCTFEAPERPCQAGAQARGIPVAEGSATEPHFCCRLTQPAQLRRHRGGFK